VQQALKSADLSHQLFVCEAQVTTPSSLILPRSPRIFPHAISLLATCSNPTDGEVVCGLDSRAPDLALNSPRPTLLHPWQELVWDNELARIKDQVLLLT
jgi:hypothetical protein